MTILGILIGTGLGIATGFGLSHLKMWVTRAEPQAKNRMADQLLKERLRIKGLNRHAKI
jgi:uncharacterized membrane protein